MKQCFSKIRQRTRNFVLGSTITQELPGAEVDELLAKYSSEEVTKELFDFGQMLLAADDERVGLIDSKATTLVGYSSAILAFLLIRGTGWTHSWPELIAIAIVGVIAGLACLSAGIALWGAQNWRQLSEVTWFPREQVLAGSDPLKRFYISAMHQVLQDNHRIANRKADQMIIAQVLVALAGVLLAITLTAAIATTVIRSFTSRPSELYSVSASPLTADCAAMCSAYHGLYPFAPYLMSREELLREPRELQEPPQESLQGPLQQAWHLALVGAVDFRGPRRNPHSLCSDYRQASGKYLPMKTLTSITRAHKPRKALRRGTTQKSARSELGFAGSSEIPDSLREVLRQNSLALKEITNKVPY